MPTLRQTNIIIESEVEFKSNIEPPMTQSNEPTIDQMNEVIARFMGCKAEHQGHRRPHPTLTFLINRTWWPVNALKYHTSWDWLKPVIDKIFEYAIAYPEQVKPIIDMGIVVDIKPAHEKVYQFCKWLNQQKQTNALIEKESSDGDAV